MVVVRILLLRLTSGEILNVRTLRILPVRVSVDDLYQIKLSYSSLLKSVNINIS